LSSAVVLSARRPRAWRRDLGLGSAALLLAPFVVTLALLFLVPLGWLFWVSLTEPHPGLGTYRDLLTRPVVWRAFENTLLVGAAVTTVSLVIGAFLAWELRNARSSLYRGVLWAAVLFPLWMSAIVRNYAFTVILERNGVINRALQATGLTDAPHDLLYTKLAVFLGMVHSMVPYAVLPLYGAFVLIDEDLLWAARSLGASRLRSLGSIVVPLALPSILAVGALVFVIACGYYIAPVVLGGPRNLFVATLIDQQINQLYDLPGAAAAAFLLLFGSVLVIALAMLALGWRRLVAVLS
jgi:putative spermidine/putrescine transport system permease protein